MSLQLVVGVRCDSESAAISLRDILESDSRPLFVEDVDPDYQSIYTVICDLDYPDSIEVTGNNLWIQWIDNEAVKGVNFDSIVGLFENSRFELIGAHEIPDDPLICGDEDGWYWIPAESGFDQISKAEFKRRFADAYSVLEQYWD